MIVFRSFKNIFAIPELRKKIFFTLGVLFITRLGRLIPVAGVNTALLGQMLSESRGVGGLLSYLDMFSAGALSSATLFALGISPYITASIMMQLLGMAVPQLEQLLKEGEYGRKIINQYTRYLTLGLSIVYSAGFAGMLETQGLVLNPGLGFTITFILSLTAGAMFVMWLGDQISLSGIGNGSSIIICSGIVARFPDEIIKTLHFVSEGQVGGLTAIIGLLIFIVIASCIIFLEKGERKIPVQYARRVVGQRMYAGQSTYLPFKINPTGVMPVIFASSMVNFPRLLTVLASGWFPVLTPVADFMSQPFFINVMMFILIVFFSFVYTALIFNPEELADNMKKSGGFIPGIRPGKKTAEFFDYILTRIGLVGALYLGALAVVPDVVTYQLGLPIVLGGTSILIAVGVALDISSQVESYLIEHRYEGFLESGRMKVRAVR